MEMKDVGIISLFIVGTILSESKEVDISVAANVFKEYDIVKTNFEAKYQMFTRGNSSENLMKFKNDLVTFLSGNIYVKESKLRYQQEQFERFSAAMKNSHLTKASSLNDFCQKYALLVDLMIDESHGGKCPKIEANYDDFQDKTLRPINSTIFYFFFNADRAKRTWAEWLIASARFPNEKLRNAYMRFFSSRA
jgi:hypothetical protein